MIGLAKAARLTGKNRSTIHWAMKDGRLSYTLGPDGTRLIDPAELGRVYRIINPGDAPPLASDKAPATRPYRSRYTDAERAERAEISRKKLRAREARKKARRRLRNPEKAREKDRLRAQRKSERTKPEREAAALARRIARDVVRLAKDAERKEARRQASEARKAAREAAKLSPEELRLRKNKYALAKWHERRRTEPNFLAEDNAQKLRYYHANIDHYRAKKRERSRRYRERHPERKHENYKRRSAAYKFLKDQGVVPKFGPLDIPLAVRREAALVYIRETYPELGF